MALTAADRLRIREARDQDARRLFQYDVTGRRISREGARVVQANIRSELTSAASVVTWNTYGRDDADR